MKRVFHRSFVLACVVGLALSLPAGAQKGKSPEDIAREMFSVTRQSDWATYAKLLHPDALAEFKRMFREIIAADTSAEMGKLFFNAANVQAYDSQDAGVLFERFMFNLAKNSPQFAEALKTAEGSVVGTVAERTDLAHVVYRSSAATEGIAISKVNVVTLRKHKGEWKVLLSGSIEGMAARMSQLAKRPG